MINNLNKINILIKNSEGDTLIDKYKKLKKNILVMKKI
jgi:hypothetical protein